MTTSIETQKNRIEIFAQKIAEGETQSDAYRAAYPKASQWKDKTVHTKASEFIKSGEVQRRIGELKEKALAKHDMTAEQVIAQLVGAAGNDPSLVYHSGSHEFLEPSEVPKEVMLHVQSIDHHLNGKIKKYNFASKDKSRELLGRYFNLFKEQLGETPEESKKAYDPVEVARRFLFVMEQADHQLAKNNSLEIEG